MKRILISVSFFVGIIIIWAALTGDLAFLGLVVRGGHRRYLQ